MASSESSLPIPFATVELVELQRASDTDIAGYFSFIEVPAGTWTLRVSAFGFETLEQRIDLGVDAARTVDLVLDPDPLRIPGITVEAAKTADPAGPGAFKIDIEAAKVVPALAEPDLLRAAQILPAVSAASDYSSALYVRGGAPDQTLVLLDGIPIFNPYHFGGVFGAFNPDAVASVDVLPGALPAGYGDRLSSVVSIRTREGGRGDHQGSGGFGLVSARATVDGPLPGGKGSYLFSGRRSYLDMVGGGITGDGIMPRSYETGFQDGLLSVSHEVGRFGLLSMTMFADQEWIGLPDSNANLVDYDWNWGTRLGGLRLQTPIGPSRTLSLRAGWSDFTTSLDSRWQSGAPGSWDPTVRARGTMRDFLVGGEMEWWVRGHELRVGAVSDFYSMDFDSWRAEDPPEGFLEEYVPQMKMDESLNTVAAFVEDQWKVTDALHIRGGVRVLSSGGGQTEWAPRVGARLDLSRGLSFSLGAGRYVQAVHSIRVEEAVGTNFMSYDLLRPVDPAEGFMVSEDAVLGVAWVRNAFSLRLDGYVKRAEGLRLPAIPVDPRHAQVLEPEDFFLGEGEAKGFEVLGQYGSGLTGVWLSYAFVRVKNTVDGVEYTPRFERRHTLDVMTRVSLPDGIRLTLRNVLATGQPTTPANGLMWPLEYDPLRRGFDNDLPSQTLLLGDHNSLRTPTYWRVDVGARFSYDKELWKRPISLSPYAEIINLLNLGNVVFWEPSSPNRKDDPFLQLPMTITAGLEWSF